MRKRDPRRKVLVRARMRSGAEWGDVLIHNMSSRGLLAAASVDCRPGTVIEIRRVHHVIVGRVVWQSDGYFGVRTQDVIDIDGIVAAKPPAHKPVRAGECDGDRRAATRRAIPLAEREARSRRFAAGFQYAVLVIAIGAAAVFAAQRVGVILSRPFATIGAHLDGSATGEQTAHD